MIRYRLGLIMAAVLPAGESVAQTVTKSSTNDCARLRQLQLPDVRITRAEALFYTAIPGGSVNMLRI